MRERTPHIGDMTAGDMAYFYITPRVGLVAFAILAGSPYLMPENEVMLPLFSWAVDVKEIHYVSPPIKCKGKGKFQWVTALEQPLPLLVEIRV